MIEHYPIMKEFAHDPSQALFRVYVEFFKSSFKMNTQKYCSYITEFASYSFEELKVTFVVNQVKSWTKFTEIRVWQMSFLRTTYALAPLSPFCLAGAAVFYSWPSIRMHVKNVLHPFLPDDVTIQQLNTVYHLLHTSIHLDIAKQWFEKQ